MKIEYELNNAHVCHDNVCFKISSVLIKSMTHQVFLGLPFINSLGYIYIYIYRNVIFLLASSHALHACGEAFFLAKKKKKPCVFILKI